MSWGFSIDRKWTGYEDEWKKLESEAAKFIAAHKLTSDIEDASNCGLCDNEPSVRALQAVLDRELHPGAYRQWRRIVRRTLGSQDLHFPPADDRYLAYSGTVD